MNERMASLRATIATLLFVIVLTTSHPVEDTVSKPELSSNQEPQIQEGETSDNQRTKRQYYYPAWTSNEVIRVPFVQGYAIWQPQQLQIKRPYIIPIWGSAGRVPVYLPPQPIYINPGYPHDNPPSIYPGIPYLPPVTDVPTTSGNTTIETDNKLNIDGPVWDQVSNVRPTRPTKRPGQRPVTHPPLVHKESSPTPDTVEKSAGTPIGQVRPNTGGAARPTKPQTTPAPAKEAPELPKQPSRCVWAIISCCSATSQHVSYSCFEQLGCTGAFWDTSPCESEFARAAISTAMNYYNAK